MENIISSGYAPKQAIFTYDPSTSGFRGLRTDDLNSAAAVDKGLTWLRNTGISATAVQVKAGAGNLYGWNLINSNTNPAYLKFYDKDSSPTVGVDRPTNAVVVLAGSTTVPAITFSAPTVTPFRYFSSGIWVTVNTGVNGIFDTTATGPSVNLYAEIAYK